MKRYDLVCIPMYFFVVRVQAERNIFPPERVKMFLKTIITMTV